MRARILIWFWYQLRHRLIKRIQEGQVAKPGLTVSSIHKLKRKHTTRYRKVYLCMEQGERLSQGQQASPMEYW